MKLFQRMLIAPAALGLLAPISTTAFELNLKDFSNYSSSEGIERNNFSNLYPSDWAFKALSETAISRGCNVALPKTKISRHEAAALLNNCLANVAELNSQEQLLLNEFATELTTIRGRVDGIEAQVSQFEAGGFSSTTKADFSADFIVGAVDGSASGEALTFDYQYTIALGTSFTGDDNLSVEIDAGNGGNSATSAILDSNTGANVLNVDGISYTFPVGDKITLIVGDATDVSALYTGACVYSAFTDLLGDCGTGNSAGVGGPAAGKATFAGSYDAGNGFTFAGGISGTSGGTSGVFTKESLDVYGLQAAYSADQWGAAVSYALSETSTTAETTYWGFNAYWTPSDATAFPSISVGYETEDPSASSSTKDGFFVGLGWDEVGPGSFSLGLGSVANYAESDTEYYQYEASYSYPINDSMTITPGAYIKETSGDDETGLIVVTNFSF
tara:strand:+ start:1414 stop:2748 length:1335 start_codon:yes stop_codon:yes gene_type:complete